MRDEQPPKKKSIPPAKIRAFYPVVRDVARGELHRPTGIRTLVDEYGLNENSARDFIDNFRKLLKGEEYQRSTPFLPPNTCWNRSGRTSGRTP
ncbi:MAG: hypothetical protein K2X82_16445 [Gemmataceae bacterium]|nr:hypothetical protein [Gemmataceae bacterium]